MPDCYGQDRCTTRVNEAVVSTPIYTFPNRSGSQIIALGSLDQMGLVELRPRASNFTSLAPIYVSARAPFVGYLDGPIDVYPVWKFDTASYGVPETLPLLDLIAFEKVPHVAPSRAVMSISTTSTLNVSGNSTNVMVYKVTGRQRVRVIGWNQTAARNATMNVYALGVSGGTGTVVLPTLDTHATTARSSVTEFSTQAQWAAGATVPPPGFGMIDYIAVQIVSGTAADVWAVDIEAWD